MSLSFVISASFAGDVGMMWTSKHWIALAAALGGCAFWALICFTFGWSLAGVAGVVLGLIAGGCFYALLLSRSDPAAALAAAAIAAVTLLVSSAWQQRAAESVARMVAVSDESYIAALAEQIQWQGGEASPGVSDGEVPPDVLAQATAAWQAMPAAEKDKLRATREKWLASSHGEDLDEPMVGPLLRTRTSCAALASVLALLVAACPAIAARFVGWEQP